MSDTTHFGFREIPEHDKASLVRGVFDSVAPRYDLMNDLMSGGLHRLWKNAMIAWLAPRDGMHILDVAGGTGDIAFRLREHARCDITLLDINQSMLEEGRGRAIDRNLLAGMEWICADAEALPLPDQSFDAYTIAFGIRNMTHIDRALREAKRVLKPGGRFLCLEFSHLASPLLQKAYDAYSFHVIPKIGQMITGHAESYRYLVESIRRFPDAESFAKTIEAAGLGNVQIRSMTGGVVALHSARRL